jgi:tetratricopeptide (TPR) repeat protein
MYIRLARYDEALRVFQESIRRKPSAHAYSNMGTCYYFLGDFARSAEAFEKAVELVPGDYLYWRNLGDAWRWTPGSEDKARRAYTRAIELSEQAVRVAPGEALAHVCRATSMAKIGRTREARAAILRALELEPQNSGCTYEAAVIANIAGDAEEAITRLEQSLRLGHSGDEIQRDPEFANLRKSGRLNAIIQASRSTPQ